MGVFNQEEEIQFLKRKLLELEAKILDKGNNFTAFGRSYSLVGSSSNDFLIKTKGLVKILWGNKFIDLIKEGKINVDSKMIYKQKEVGVKDGIYIIGDNEDLQILLVVDGKTIDLKGKVGTTYVSFLGEQNTTSENKYLALRNIGFLYPSILDIDDSAVKNGIVYIESELKLYIISNGSLLLLSVEFPNPYNKQFILTKEDSDIGALVIKGSGKENSIVFESMIIYSLSDGTYFDSDGTIYARVNGMDKMLISDLKVVFSNVVVSLEFLSSNASKGLGFRLYDDGGTSTLEIDNLILRGQTKTSALDMSQVFDLHWYYRNNIINTISPDGDDFYDVLFIFPNQFLALDSIYVYTSINIGDLYDRYVLVPLLVILTNNEISIKVTLNYDHLSSEELEFISSNLWSITSSMSGKTCFLVGSDSEILLPKLSSTGFEIIKSTSFDDEANVLKVLVRIGNLDSLKLKSIENTKEVDIEGAGVYSDLATFRDAKYTSNYTLPIGDNSSKFASTEWVNKSLPIGSIIMFGGKSSDIPEGWAICDGTNGTPNLVGRFIKAAGTDGGVGTIPTDLNENNELTLSTKHLPKHSHPHKPHTHTIQLNTSTITTGSSGTLSVDLNYNDYIWNLKTNNKSVVTSVEAGEGVTTSKDTVTEVSSFSTLGGSATGGSHTHTVSLSGLDITVDNSTSQEETLSDLDWPNIPIRIEPRAYSLIFIMKIK